MNTETAISMNRSNKRRQVECLLEKCRADLARARAARADAQFEANEHKGRIESRYDTFREEAQYLAGGQARRCLELEETVRKLERFLAESRSLDHESENARPGSLVRVMDDHGNFQSYLLLPAGGGLLLETEDDPLLVVNLNTPMGQALLGRSIGAGVVFNANTARPRRLVIVGVS